MEGRRIRELRLKKGISINKLSRMTGISKSYLSFLERDIKSNPSLEILKKIVESLDTEIEYLIDTKLRNIDEKHKHDKSLLTLQIELSEEELDQEKYRQLKELIYLINKK
jgi:XRE family transcriptional regulator of biofilm formation